MPKPKVKPPVDTPEQARKKLQDYLDKTFALFPHLKYKPNPSQHRWLSMIQTGLENNKIKFGVFDGNSSGKTLWGVNLLWNIICPPEHRNPWFKVPFIENWSWPKHIRIVCKADDLKEPNGTIWTLINEWWPKGEYTTKKQDHPYVSVYEHVRTKFTISVRTFDQPVEAHDDGSTIALVYFNEPPPSSVWNAYPARLRKGGFLLATATLVRESEFFKDDVIDNPRAAYSMGDIEGNCRQHARLTVTDAWLPERKVELTGTLEHEHLENIIAGSPRREQEARRTGRPVHLSGASFTVYPEIHFVPQTGLPDPKECQCSILALDPHQRRPWAFVVLLKDHQNRHWLVDEWPTIHTEPWCEYYHRIESGGVGRDFYVNAIKTAKSKWGVTDTNSVIDSKFAGQLVTEDMQSWKLREILLYKHGLYFQSGATSVRGQGGGIDVLEQALYVDRTKPVSYENSPSLFIADHCENVKHQIQNVIWDEFVDPDRMGMKEVMDEKYLDFPRLIMYGLMHHARHADRVATKEEAERLTLEEKWERVRREFPNSETVPAEDFEGDALAIYT